MIGKRAMFGWVAVLAVAFAVHVGMTVQLAGRSAAAPLVATLALGAFAIAVVAAGRPVRVVASMARADQALAAIAGVLLVFGAPAMIASVRMTDAPSGSIVVFWMSGGWAALAALSAAVLAWRRSVSVALLSLAGGLAALVGVAGVVANWERPSSFSPLVRFPSEELAILGAGVLVVVGVLLLLRAAREGTLDGAIVCGTGAGAVAAFVWWAVNGLHMELLSEKPVDLALASLAWGLVCIALPRVVRSAGLARAGALLVLAPLLLTGLIGIEQLVGVAGPQPMIVTGVTAGALVLLAGSAGLWRAGSTPGTRPAVRGPWLWLAPAPLALAAVGLAMPAITATANVALESGRFVGSWTLLGWESVSGLAALAVGGLAGALVRLERPVVPAALALAACGVWTLLSDVPMHVLTGTLSPGIEQYYGTEYGSITFVALTNWWSVAAVILAASVLVILTGVSLVRLTGRRSAAKNER